VSAWLAALLLAPAQADPLERVDALERRLREAIDLVKPAYVFFGNGSGVCISADGWVLTNFHVSGDRPGQRVRMSGGKLYTADVVGFDPQGDIALCRIRGAENLPFCSLGDSDRLEVGQPVFAVGNPFLLARGSWEPTVTQGIVSALHRYMDNPGYFDAIQTDAQINPGNSGGPLFTLDGRIAGINGRIDIRRFSNRVNTGIGYAIPAKQIERYLEAFKRGGRVFEGFVSGVQVGECGDTRYEKVGRYGDGVFVARVDGGSPADRAGFEPGDIVVEAEGYRIGALNRFHGVVSNWPEGSTIRVKVKRGVEEKELRVLLGDPEAMKERAQARGGAALGFRPVPGPVPTAGPVYPGGAADRAGLRPGDVLLKVDGEKAKGWDELIGKVRPGASIRLTVKRDGQEHDLTLSIPE
jgi:serine protease Do